MQKSCKHHLEKYEKNPLLPSLRIFEVSIIARFISSQEKLTVLALVSSPGDISSRNTMHGQHSLNLGLIVLTQITFNFSIAFRSSVV